MSNTNAYAVYAATQTVTANQTKLIIMLHDGAIRFLAQAVQAIRRKDYPEKAVAFGKAYRIVQHLWTSVDPDRGGDVAANLGRIYAFSHSQLLQANLHDDIAVIEQVMGYLREIRDAWEQQGQASRSTSLDAADQSPFEERVLAA